MNRNIKKQLWLNEQEERLLKEKARRTCLSEAGLLRMLLRDYEPKEKPDAAFYHAMNGITSIGNSLNQLVQRAHVMGFVDEVVLEEEISRLRELRLAIEQKYLEPDKRRDSWHGSNENMACQRTDQSSD